MWNLVSKLFYVVTISAMWIESNLSGANKYSAQGICDLSTLDATGPVQGFLNLECDYLLPDNYTGFLSLLRDKNFQDVFKN